MEGVLFTTHVQRLQKTVFLWQSFILNNLQISLDNLNLLIDVFKCRNKSSIELFLIFIVFSKAASKILFLLNLFMNIFHLGKIFIKKDIDLS